MSETTGTPELNKALAQLQADLPKIAKGQTASVPGKDGKQGYKYDYADLADISQEVLPKLGALGLAFTSRPTLVDGQFGLVYELVHNSGEAKEGFYPLPSSGTPQTIGSAITYARRYSLCAVTGIAPGGDDDDAQAASGQAVQMSRQRGEDWRNQPPVSRPRGTEGNGHVTRPAQAQPQQAAPGDASADPDPDAQAHADEAAAARSLDALRAVHKQAFDAGKLGATIRDPASGKTGPLGPYLEWRRKQLTDDAKAWKELQDAAVQMSTGELEAHVQIVTGVSVEAATAAQLREAAKALKAGAPA